MNIKPNSPLGNAISAAYLLTLGGLIYFVTTGLNSTGEDMKSFQEAMMQHVHEEKPEAILWAATQHYLLASEADAALKKLAEMGNPEGMYLYGQMLVRAGDPRAAYDWYKKSAAEGFPAAVRLILINPEAPK